MLIKDNFKVEEIDVGEDEWVVTNHCYGSRQARWSFNNEEDAQSFIDSWIDVTLDDKDPYKIGTEWWYFNSYERNIIRVEIIDIEVCRWTLDKYRYFSSSIKCRVVGSEEELDLDADVVEHGEMPEEAPSKEEVLRILSKKLKANYTDFIQL